MENLLAAVTIRLWRGNATAIHNARQACSALERSRRDREDVEAFLATWRESTKQPLSA